MSQTARQAFRYSSVPGAQVFGLCFSADYCKWCRDFTPKLTELYPHLLERGVEIVLVGSDKTQEAHDAYRSQQPRPAGRFDDDIRIELRDEFYVNPIPTLIFVGQEGNVVNRDGCSLVDIAAINENNRQTVEWVASQVGVGSPFRYDSDNSDF
ncbi:hypothetical protein JG687_00018291 [Phytophthora cactorum]|uniref:protein-disulfide reductase n=1 Tax=Phytophthora cactorum TaxID=29920 RepID=A0A329RAU7_9STRA|nr:hypothetical protein Pcac1_g20829 [Phytophthora cactorum]KAG2791596.1 hypothetical protein PC111_g23852 [Phytophthora cactorum]KAG2843556.1 hypothetical protein PC112_g2563 [Phytophthora cactorum]KAG2866751.1 hypothetical protein PC113_g2528 [Phytophthora cactorum]KAG2929509.1 hypothetical protein PC114_g2736 [Phytophthora cactorum]